VAEENLSGRQAASAKESAVPKKEESVQPQKGAPTEHYHLDENADIPCRLVDLA
jgi:hypothetical protein